LHRQVRLFATQSHHAERLAEAVSKHFPVAPSIYLGSASSICTKTLLVEWANTCNLVQEKSESRCTSQLRSMIDQVSIQQEKIVALEGTDTNLLSQI
jgi:hypothetical protein